MIGTANVTTIAGQSTLMGRANGVGTLATFNRPSGLMVDPSGAFLFVVDGGNHAIRKIILASMSVSTFAGGDGTNVGGYADGLGTSVMFSYPISLAIDPTGRYFFVSDSNNQLIRRVALANANVTTFAGVLNTAGRADGTSGTFAVPYGVACTSNTLYIGDL